jgi:cytochrome c oxidase subunit 2
MFLISLVAAIIGTAAVLLLDWFPQDASTASGPIDTLYDVLLIASVPIFVLVMAVAIYSVVKFRARPGDMRDGAPIHGNTRLEILWVTGPFILVTALAIYGWVILDDIEAKKPNALRVEVRAQQFAWRFTYPDEGGLRTNQLVLPKDRPVEFAVTTNDVIHSFWVPQFRLKTDTVPGLTTRLRVTPNREGRYDVVCAELCGLGHATMRQAVRVVPQQEFGAWLSQAKGRQKQVGGETPRSTGGSQGR